MIEVLLVLTGIFLGAFVLRPLLDRLFYSNDDVKSDNNLTDFELNHLIILIENTQKSQYHSVSASCLKKLNSLMESRGYEKR